MNKPRKHAECIKAWADGAEIECRAAGRETWVHVAEPSWLPNDVEYRVKPRPPTYGEVALAAWSTDFDWELVARAVIKAYKAREGGKE